MKLNVSVSGQSGPLLCSFVGCFRSNVFTDVSCVSAEYAASAVSSVCVSFILVLFLLFVGVCSCIIRHRVFVLGQWGKAVRRITWRRVFQKCTNTWDASTSRPHLKELPPSSKRATFSRRLCSDSLGSNRKTRLSSVFLILFMAKHKQLHF